jgi:hypothetical protein
MMNFLPKPLVATCLTLVGTVACAANPHTDESTPRDIEKVASASTSERAPASGWVTIIGAEGASGVTGLGRNLVECRDVEIDDDASRLKTEPGVGVVAATKKFAYGDDNNLNSVEHFGDCEVSLEFLLGEGCNSGVKLQGRYEIQLYDSWGKDDLTGTECGGVYPHWVNGKHKIKYIDEGVPPLRNAAKRPGEWQTLRIVFKAPRFNADGEKVENARFTTVMLNGELVQQDVEIDSPTGNTSDPLPEVAMGPLYLQMDHGAVAFRQVRVKRN